MAEIRGRERGGLLEGAQDRITRDLQDRRGDKFGGRVPSAGEFAPGGSLSRAPGSDEFGGVVGIPRGYNPNGNTTDGGFPDSGGGGFFDQLMRQFNNPITNKSGAPEIFQPGLVPFSGSQSGSESISDSSSVSGSASGSDSSSLSGAQSSSGIDFDNPFVSGITEQLSEYARNLEPNIQEGTERSLALAKEGGRGYLEGGLQTALNSLAQRGILGSSEAKNILSDVGSRGVEGQRIASLQAGVNESNQRMQIPNILTQMAQLGQGSQSGSFGQTDSTSRGTSFGNQQSGSQSTSGSQSLQANPLAPFDLAERFISNQTV